MYFSLYIPSFNTQYYNVPYSMLIIINVRLPWRVYRAKRAPWQHRTAYNVTSWKDEKTYIAMPVQCSFAADFDSDIKFIVTGTGGFGQMPRRRSLLFQWLFHRHSPPIIKKKVSDQTIERNEEIKRKQHPCLPGCLLSLHTLHDVIPPVCVCVLCCGIGIARCCPLRSFRLLSFHLQTEMTYYWIND